ncbi:MAG: metallophosphoesterase [Planctomycetia bacterium]|nr:metallophosphoesterase [Planctomycetia bacterium]
MKRRTFLRLAGSSLGLAAGLGIYTWRIEPHWVDMVHRPLPIRGLPPAWNGRTLVHLSDIHVGPVVDDSYIIETFHRVAALKPDVVVLTGDLMSDCPDVDEKVRAVYQHVPHGRLATLATLGNHDYGPGWTRPDLAQQLCETLSEFGVRVLRNETSDVDGLQIVGLDDLWAGRFKPEAPLSQLDPRRAAIALTHNPDTVDLPVWDGFRGWILAGHTHGGQCKPPFLPPPLLPVQNRRYTCGEFDLAGDRKMYINRGLGYLRRVRFNVRPEVTVFTLCLA